jgi:hypothetical protein
MPIKGMSYSLNSWMAFSCLQATTINLHFISNKKPCFSYSKLQSLCFDFSPYKWRYQARYIVFH